MRPLLLRLITALIAAVFALVCLEVALRLAPAAQPAIDTRVDNRGKPSDWRRPEFRFPEQAPRREKSAPRIVVLGDSFTWGSGVYVEDAYPQRLATLLKTALGRDVEVISWSRPGWNTRAEVDSLRPRLGELDPDLVLVGYCLNDAEPRDQRQLETLREGFHRRQPEGTAAWLHRRSRLFAWTWERYENWRMQGRMDRYYHDLHDPEQPGWNATRVALRELGEAASRRQFPLILVIFPIFDQDPDAGYRYSDLHLRVAEAAREEGIETLDLLPEFAGIAGDRLAVRPFEDGHPNELAHRIAAEALARELAPRLAGGAATSER